MQRVLMIGLLLCLGVDPQRLALAAEVAPPPLVSGQRAQVQRLLRDMQGTMQSIQQDGVAALHDPAQAKRWQDRLAQYENAMARFPQHDDPDVRAAKTQLTELEELLADARQQAVAQLARLGDIQARLAGVDEALQRHRAPRWLAAPFDDVEARQWVAALADAQQTAQQSIESLTEIAAQTRLPPTPGTVQEGAPYDQQDLDRMRSVAERSLRDVQEAVQQTLANLRTQFQNQDRELEYFRSLDPDNPAHRMNAFLREGAAADIYARLDAELAMAQSFAAYQHALGKAPTEATVQRLDEIAALRRRYAEHRLKAIGESRLPEPKSSDAARIDAAKAILAKPRYGFGPHGPVVLTTPQIVEREQQLSQAELKRVDVSLSGQIHLTGTETTWNYRWEEFKFVTPLRDANGDWYLWWITAKRFSSGAAQTPIGEWVSGAATKGDLILERNFAG